MNNETQTMAFIFIALVIWVVLSTLFNIIKKIFSTDFGKFFSLIFFSIIGIIFFVGLKIFQEIGLPNEIQIGIAVVVGSMAGIKWAKSKN